MASLQALLPNTTNLASPSKRLRIASAIRAPSYLKNPRIVVPKLPSKHDNKQQLVFLELDNKLSANDSTSTSMSTKDIARLKLSTILEFVNDRIEMHHNIGEQRENWNSLLLNSLNMITLTATTMAGLAGALNGTPVLPLKISSFLLFSAATGILMVMNKIQPSQLVEEQRCAVRLFKKLKNRIESTLALNSTPTEKEVEGAIENMLAIDRAYPLPLLGAMLEKFPETFKPSVWWGPHKSKNSTSATPLSSPKGLKSMQYVKGEKVNGWSEGLEEDMKEIVGVIKKKDIEDYVRLGNKALMLNKTLAISGPILMGLAAVGSAFVGHGGGLVAGVAGSLATIVNTIEHGGQVGMVFEMYRNCAGFFNLLEENVESTLKEGDLEKRENGEIFEMKMALHLGRSLSDLRDLAGKSRRNGGFVNEFANKLF